MRREGRQEEDCEQEKQGAESCQSHAVIVAELMGCHLSQEKLVSRFKNPTFDRGRRIACLEITEQRSATMVADLCSVISRI
jgi:hypothetical protein